jgi:hypothetical protein
MDRRKFLFTGGSAVGAVGSAVVGLNSVGAGIGADTSVIDAPLNQAKGSQLSGAASAQMNGLSSNFVNNAPRAVAAQVNPAQRFQVAYLAHGSVGRASLNRVPFNVPFALVFRGFGARADNSDLTEVNVEAGYYAPDSSIIKHQTWSHTQRHTSSGVRINVARDNFIGFFASYQSTAGATGTDVYPFNTDLPLEYGSYVFASRSISTGQFPDWADYVYSGDINRPLLNTANPLAALDFDYLSYSITRST